MPVKKVVKHMTFNQINYFLAVAEHLNFTRAAAVLFVTQSTLSRSIAALETELGIALLSRDSHSVQLTPAGELMYREMKVAMKSINSILRHVQALGDAENDSFVIGVLEGQSVENSVLFAIRALSDSFPHLNVDIRRQYHQTMVDEIKANQMDVGQSIITDDDELDPELDYLPLKTLHYYLIAQKDDPIWVNTPSLALLGEHVLIMPGDMHPGLEAVNRQLVAAGITPQVKKCPDMETQALLLESGMGIYIGNEDNIIYASRSFRPVAAKRLEGLSPMKEVLIWSKNNRQRILDRFLSILRRSLVS